MNVVIFGAGTVGTSIAELLCSAEHNHNVCIVDASARALGEVEERLDVQSVQGSACDVATLFQAGVQSADLCLAVTSGDETNLVAASISKAMGAGRSVARIYRPALRDTSTFDYRRHFKIDRLFSLEFLTALELAKQVRERGLFTVENFARGGIEVREVGVDAEASIIGVPMRDLDMPRGVRVGVITSGNRSIIAGADDVVRSGDHVTLIGTTDAVEAIKKRFEARKPKTMNVVIAGGGEIGYHLAKLLENRRFNVTLMESDEHRAEELSRRLDKTTILHADATRRSEMEEARIGKADAFIACTGRDEDNIICGVEAREFGCRRILCVVRRPDYANVLAKLGIDVAVSPREVLARQVLGLVDAGPVLDRTLLSGEAEVWEVEILAGSPVTEAPLKELQLTHALIAAIERDEFVRVPGADDQLQAGDTAVVLVQGAYAEATRQMFLPTKNL